MRLREDNSDRIKSVNDTINSIKGILLDADSDSAVSFVGWMMKKLRDKYNNSMETNINQEIRRLKRQNDQASNERLIKLKKKKKQYMSKEYPQSLEIGDIVNVKFGYGYCDEIEDNHYAIILSKIVGSMFLIAPLTSNEPKGGRMLFYDDLMLPSKNKTTERSYILFNQIRFAHYRRLENIHIIGRRHIDITRVREILAIFNEIVTL